jgi:hypothetical protein
LAEPPSAMEVDEGARTPSPGVVATEPTSPATILHPTPDSFVGGCPTRGCHDDPPTGQSCTGGTGGFTGRRTFCG